MRSSPGRLVFMSLFATALGLAGGAAAWVLVRLIALLTNAALLHEYGWNLPSFRHFHPGPDLILVAMGEAKVEAVARAVEGPVTAMTPASSLQLHPHASVVVDEAAAAGLRLADYYREAYAGKPPWQGL